MDGPKQIKIKQTPLSQKLSIVFYVSGSCEFVGEFSSGGFA